MNTAKGAKRAKLRKTGCLIYRNGILHAIAHEDEAAEAIALLQSCYPANIWTFAMGPPPLLCSEEVKNESN